MAVKGSSWKQLSQSPSLTVHYIVLLCKSPLCTAAPWHLVRIMIILCTIVVTASDYNTISWFRDHTLSTGQSNAYLDTCHHPLITSLGERQSQAQEFVKLVALMTTVRATYSALQEAGEHVMNDAAAPAAQVVQRLRGLLSAAAQAWELLPVGPLLLHPFQLCLHMSMILHIILVFCYYLNCYFYFQYIIYIYIHM